MPGWGKMLGAMIPVPGMAEVMDVAGQVEDSTGSAHLGNLVEAGMNNLQDKVMERLEEGVDSAVEGNGDGGTEAGVSAIDARIAALEKRKIDLELEELRRVRAGSVKEPGVKRMEPPAPPAIPEETMDYDVTVLDGSLTLALTVVSGGHGAEEKREGRERDSLDPFIHHQSNIPDNCIFADMATIGLCGSVCLRCEPCVLLPGGALDAKSRASVREYEEWRNEAAGVQGLLARFPREYNYSGQGTANDPYISADCVRVGVVGSYAPCGCTMDDEERSPVPLSELPQDLTCTRSETVGNWGWENVLGAPLYCLYACVGYGLLGVCVPAFLGGINLRMRTRNKLRLSRYMVAVEIAQAFAQQHPDVQGGGHDREIVNIDAAVDRYLEAASHGTAKVTSDDDASASSKC